MGPILVGGHVQKVLVVFRVLAILGLLTGVGVYFAEPIAGFAVFVCSLLISLIVEAVLFQARRKRRWLTDTGEGIVIKDRNGERSYDDEDVFAVELEIKKVYSQGVYKGIQRNFRMKIQGEAQPFEVDNMIPEAQADPFAGLIDRLIAAYRSGADEALREGAVVEGKNWSLNNTSLTAKSSAPVSVPLTELDSVGVFDAEVCVWRKGEDTAFLKTPVRSANAFLLQLLLEQRLSERDPEEGQSTEGLGRVLFERKGTSLASIFLWLLVVLLALPALLLVIVGFAGNPAGIVVGLVLLVLCAPIVWASRKTKRPVFRCHERGVFKQGMFSSGQLRYEELESFSYSATRQYYNGAYIGTALNLSMAPRKDSGKKPINFSRTVKNVDEALDELRDHISMVLANDMLRRLADGERVAWTSNMALLPQGIEYRPAGFVKRKEAVVLPYQNVFNFDLQQGTFHLWEHGKDKSVMQESVGVPNFFPGYFALARLFSQAAQQEEST